MRRVIMAAGVAAAFAAASPIHAQVGFGIGGGPSIPTGSLSDVVDTGLHGGVVIDFGLPLLPFGVRGDLMYHRYPGSGTAPNLQQFAATANGRFSLLPLPLLSAYITAGAGLYASDFDSGQADSSGWSTDAGINAGVGGRINLLVVRPFVEVRYHRVLSDPARSFVPVTFGIFF